MIEFMLSGRTNVSWSGRELPPTTGKIVADLSPREHYYSREFQDPAAVVENLIFLGKCCVCLVELGQREVVAKSIFVRVLPSLNLSQTSSHPPQLC